MVTLISGIFVFLVVGAFFGPIIGGGWFFLKWIFMDKPEEMPVVAKVVKIPAAKAAGGKPSRRSARHGGKDDYLDVLSIDIGNLAARNHKED